jgi:hypothetical protein
MLRRICFLETFERLQVFVREFRQINRRFADDVRNSGSFRMNKRSRDCAACNRMANGCSTSCMTCSKNSCGVCPVSLVASSRRAVALLGAPFWRPPRRSPSLDRRISASAVSTIAERHRIWDGPRSDAWPRDAFEGHSAVADVIPLSAARWPAVASCGGRRPSDALRPA